ncbi:MAG: ABC transporter permease, partial [bacterium]
MLDVIRQWLRTAFRRDALNREMSDEMREHLERSTVRLMSRGMSRADATSAARREFGNVGSLQEEGRAARGGTWIDSLRADFRYAVRGLRATPVFTTVAILSLAIGIGANTAIFSLINAVMLKSLPVERPSELVQFVLTDGGKTLASSGRSFPNSFWEALRDQRGGIGAFSGFAVSGRTEFDLAEGSEARLVSGVVVNGDYFRTLGIRPALGRLISRADDARGCQATVVVSHAFWQAELGRRTNVINTTLRMGQQPFTIIGVAPASFFGTNVGIAPKLYVPVCAIGSERLDSRDFWWLNVLGRLNAGVSLAQANASLGAMSRDLLDASMPTRSTNAAATARRLQLVAAGKGMSYVRDEYAPALLALMGMVALVLLISCANVANLLLARGMARGRETAIRMAIGASRARLLRQHLTEGVVLAAGGAVAGIGLAHFGSRLLLALLDRGDSVNDITVDLSLDGRVLAFTMAVGVATVMICALVPAWRST